MNYKKLRATAKFSRNSQQRYTNLAATYIKYAATYIKYAATYIKYAATYIKYAATYIKYAATYIKYVGTFAKTGRNFLLVEELRYRNFFTKIPQLYIALVNDKTFVLIKSLFSLTILLKYF